MVYFRVNMATMGRNQGRVSFEGEDMATAIILIIIFVAAVFAGRKMIATWTGRSDCCGAGGDVAAKPKKVKVADTNEANYPYAEDIKVSGMSCEECVRNVENALNALGDTWASVDLRTGNAHIRSKKPVDVEAAKKAITDAGYYIRQF